MSKYEWDNHKDTDFTEFERFFRDSNIQPIYDTRADYTTNAPSFYEYLAKHNHLIKILAQRIYDYDKELAKRFEEWAKNIEQWEKNLEDFDDEVKRLLQDWIDDGTFADIINEEIFDMKLDKDMANDSEINIREFGVTGNGEDETELIQNALDSGENIFFPEGIYNFDKLSITQSNQTLRISEGAIFQGKNDDMDIFSGAIEVKGKGELFNTTLANDTNEMDNVIYVTDTDGFLKGDFIKISQTDNSGTTLSDTRQKWISTIATISNVDSERNSITLIESLPHAFQTKNNAKVYKLDMIKNVKIIGESKILFDKMFTEGYSNHIICDYAHNVTISNFEFVNGGGKGIRLSNTHTYTISDILHRNPTKTTAGQGYGFQAELGTCYGRISNFTGYKARHTIDFANGSHHCIVENCYSFGGGYNGHGMNTKYITFKNCHAYSCGFGVGNDTFKSDELYIFEDCHVYNHDIGFAISNESNNIKIINCTCRKTTTSILILQDSFDIDIINFNTDDCTNGMDIRLSHDVRLSNVFISNYISKGLLIRMKATNILLENVYIRDSKSATGGVEAISLFDVTNITINNLTIRGEMRRAISVNDNSNNITIDKPDIEITVAPIAIDINNTNTIDNINVKISNAIKIKSNGLGINSYKGDLYIINSDITGMLLEGLSNYTIINNIVRKSINVRSTTDTSIIGNVLFGTVSLPENNESNNIVVNNNRKVS